MIKPMRGNPLAGFLREIKYRRGEHDTTIGWTAGRTTREHAEGAP